MNLLWFSIGLGLPTLSGFCIVEILEWRNKVLTSLERWVLGFAVGLLSVSLLSFIASAFAHISLTLTGFLGIHILLLLVVGSLRYLFARNPMHNHAPKFSWKTNTWSLPLKIILILLAIWSFGKIAAATFDLVTTPTFFNDSVTNWNARGKVYFTQKKFSLDLPSQTTDDSVGGISSYPPAIPFVKAWLATLAGGWNEALTNSIHMAWYFALLALVFATLRRYTSLLAAILGTYVFVSLPLPLLHGMAAYADIFMALHLFIPAVLLFHAIHAERGSAALSFLRIASVAIALIPFTKNEGLILYFPALALFSCIAHWLLLKRNTLSKRDALLSICFLMGMAIILILPWLAFKWMYGLPFGNAKPLSGFVFAWQPGVLPSVAVSLFFHGSWLLLFPLLLLLMVKEWRAAFFSRVSFLTGFFLFLFLGQLSLYLFTSLSIEAVKQTGYGRGLIHLIPLAVVLTTLLLSRGSVFSAAENGSNTQSENV